MVNGSKDYGDKDKKYTQIIISKFISHYNRGSKYYLQYFSTLMLVSHLFFTLSIIPYMLSIIQLQQIRISFSLLFCCGSSNQEMLIEYVKNIAVEAVLLQLL